MASIGSVMNYGMNLILMGFSATATAVFGVYFKLQSFVFMPIFGLTNALIPIIAYNYGAKKRDRIIKVSRFAKILFNLNQWLNRIFANYSGGFLRAPRP